MCYPVRRIDTFAQFFSFGDKSWGKCRGSEWEAGRAISEGARQAKGMIKR